MHCDAQNNNCVNKKKGRITNHSSYCNELFYNKKGKPRNKPPQRKHAAKGNKKETWRNCVHIADIFHFVPEDYRVFHVFQQQPDRGLWCPYVHYFVALNFAPEYPTKPEKQIKKNHHQTHILGTFFYN